jgi:alkyldihydroxyacetonephosphate synthase
MRQRSWWGWGWTDAALSDDDCVALAGLLPGLADRPLPVPSIDLQDARVPAGVAELPCRSSTAPVDRAGHAYGKAYRDVMRALRGPMEAPDLVCYPGSEAEVVAVLEWAAAAGVVVVPYGAGSSVVGGVEYRGDRPWLSLDMSTMDRVVEVDRTSRAGLIQAGALGPVLEDQLRPHGLTLRHFPQSFEFSTVGGWLATRSGGHYATLYTHIDDLVESLRVVTGAGVSESWRLPGSGAGPSPDRLFLGSEGVLGVITQAWLRLQERPRYKASASVHFGSFRDGLAAVRAVSQSGLHPANCRLLDPGEAGLAGLGDRTVLVLGVESAQVPVEAALATLVELARDHGGAVEASRTGTADAWRSTFLRMPYVRDGLARMGAIVETFETACTWDRAEEIYHAVRATMSSTVESVTRSPALVNCRLTHVYPDGPAPYFTVVTAGRPGQEVAMWDEIKLAAMETLHAHRATVTHHHAVGRDHRPGYDRQRPEPFAQALRAAKSVLDPAGILNPGVLIDP